MELKDNGHLLDKDLRQSRAHQRKNRTQNQDHDHQMEIQSQTNSEIEASEGNDDEGDEERDEMRMMVRYWRSKSLPYAYLPPIGESSRHPNNTSIDSGSGCSSVFCSEVCSGGSGGGPHLQNISHNLNHIDSRKRGCNYNDPGCKPGSCAAGGSALGPGVVNKNKSEIGKNGQVVKNLGAAGGGSSGPSGEPVSTRMNGLADIFYHQIPTCLVTIDAKKETNLIRS